MCQCGLSSFDTEDFGSVVRRQFWGVEGIVFPAVSEHSAFGWMFQRAGAQSEAVSQSDQAVLSRENTGSYFAKHSEPLSSEQEAEFLSVFNNDIPMVCSDYYQTILSMIYSVVTILFSMTALANINGWIALMVVLNFVLLAVVPMAFKQALQRYKRQISETLKRYNVNLKDSIFCIPVIKSYLAEKEMLCHVNQAGQQANDADYSYTKVQENANLASMLIGYLNDFLVLVIGVYLIINGRMTVGALLAVIQISNIIANPITTLSYHINALHAVMPIKQNLWKMVQDVPKESTKSKTALPVQKIRLSDVSVVRDGRAILDHVTLELNAGKRYLLVGKMAVARALCSKQLTGILPPMQEKSGWMVCFIRRLHRKVLAKTS